MIESGTDMLYSGEYDLKQQADTSMERRSWV